MKIARAIDQFLVLLIVGFVRIVAGKDAALRAYENLRP